MKISIITTTLNSAKTVTDCIDSISNQTFKDVEHIVIDAVSVDETLNIIKTRSSKSIIISEPDNGIYDAMNKGINIATGDVIGILNSDDLYENENVLMKVSRYFESDTELDCVHGDLFYVQRKNTKEIVRFWKTGDYTFGDFRKGWHPAHPTLFLRKSVYNRFGGFNVNFKLAADFEFMLRLFEKRRITSLYIPEPLVKMRLGGATSKSIRNIFNQNIECIRAFKENEMQVSIVYPIIRLLPKVKQFFKRF